MKMILLISADDFRCLRLIYIDDDIYSAMPRPVALLLNDEALSIAAYVMPMMSAFRFHFSARRSRVAAH